MRSLLLVFIIVTSSLNAWSESHRAKRSFGFGLTLNDPLPAHYGLGLFYNINDFMQIEFAAGFASQGLGDSAADEIGTTLTTAMFWIITLGLIDWEDIRDFVKDEDEAVVRTLFAWGGGLNFFVPGWSLTPMVGIGLGGWSANNSPFGLTDSGSHVY